MKKKEFTADRVSGIEGAIFGLSIIIDAIRQSNVICDFKFPFYALTESDKKQKCEEYIVTEDYTKVSHAIVDRVMKGGLPYFEEIRKNMTRYAAVFHDEVYDVFQRLPRMSDDDLLAEYPKMMDKYAFYYGYGCVTFIYEAILSEELDQSLHSRYENSTEIIGALLASSYKSYMIDSENLLIRIKMEKDEAAKKKLIKQYEREFYFIRANYSFVPILKDEDIRKMAEEVHHHDSTVHKKEILKDVVLTEREKTIVALFKETEVIRDQRKKASTTGLFMMFRFLDEVVRRKGVDINKARRIFWRELPSLFHGDKKLSERLDSRDEVTMITDDEKAYYLEYRAVKAREEVKEGTKECKGTSASKGKIMAPIRVIIGTRDFSKFQKGEVLVTEMTRPEFVPLMKRAAAIVTDEGGLTCHAAIVSRELGIPCIVGAKNATRIFKDGDMVEVDADKGMVRIIN